MPVGGGVAAPAAAAGAAAPAAVEEKKGKLFMNYCNQHCYVVTLIKLIIAEILFIHVC